MTVDYLERLLAALEAGPSATDVIGSVAAVATTLVAIGALVYAALQINEAKASRILTRELEVQRSQPYVVAYTEESEATNLAIDLVVRNFGPTAAKDVRVQLEPWPERGSGVDDTERVGIPVFPVLAPGQEWRTLWVWSPDRKDSGLPDRHEGTVTFRGIEDVELSSPVVLDLGIYTERQWVEVHGIHEAAKALRDIRDTTKKWSEGIHGGLSVFTRDGEAKDERESARLAELRQRRADALAEQQAAADQAAAATEQLEQ